MSEPTLVLLAPLAGWSMPLSEVPDPVFSAGMAGEGVAIDPTGNTLHAPCDGEVVPMQGAKHAVTIRTALGIDVLAHVGIDTVKLAGKGFEMLVSPGEQVRAGQALLRFDLDFVARQAASLVTPVVLASPAAIVKRYEGRMLKAGEPLMEVMPEEKPGPSPVFGKPGTDPVFARQFEIPFEHGLHVRPAALVVAALRPFAARVTIACRGRSGNARSTVALMSLGAHCGELVEVTAVGADAAQALAALEPLLASPKPRFIAKPAAKAAVPRTDRGRIEAPIASRGVALGAAVQWAQAEMPVAERGEDPAGEAAALDRALIAVKTHLEALAATADGEQRAVLAAHVELIQDPGLRDAAEEWLQRGKSAAFAWRQATRATTEALGMLGDPRMRERCADLRDLEIQTLRVLAGRPPASTREFPEGAIVLADDILPSQMLALARSRVAGVCTARGGPTSHVAILAAAAGIPALVAAGPRILEIADGTVLVLDAEHGWLDVGPPAAEVLAMERAVAQRAAERAADVEAARGEAKTRDGLRIQVKANLGSLAETRGALEAGAEGCGLLRTEFLFLDRREPPDEDEQADEYQRIAAALGGRPLNIRTMDIGGDKPIAYLPLPREDNPALGMRGVRASLSQPELLRTQLRAVLRVQPAGQCRVLLPMVTDLEDLKVARAMLEEGARELGVAMPLLGVMIETPASALLAGQLADSADFLSIGTNDLSQYALAIDRGHPELAKRLDALHPAVLKLIALVADAGHMRGKSVAVCGALGSDVDALPILIGLGIHEISATSAVIPRLKRTVRLLDAAECVELARRALEQESAAAVRDLAAYARARARAARAESSPEGAP